MYSYSQRTREGRIAFDDRGVPYWCGSRTDNNGRTQRVTIRELQATLVNLLPQVANANSIMHGVACSVSRGIGVRTSASIAVMVMRGRRLCRLGRCHVEFGGPYTGRSDYRTHMNLAHLSWVNRQVARWESEPLRWLGMRTMYHRYRLADRYEKRGLPTTAPAAKLADAIVEPD